MSEPTFKFVFRVSSSTGGRREWKSNPGESVNAEDLLNEARDFFERLPAMVELSQSAAKGAQISVQRVRKGSKR